MYLDSGSETVNDTAMPDNPREASGDKYRADYIKSNYFRVVHADGVFGGLTPRGYIQLDIWSERQPIPKQSVYPLTREGDGGSLGDELMSERIARDAAIREVEVGIVVDIPLAKSLIKWLQDRVAQAEAVGIVKITEAE